MLNYSMMTGCPSSQVSIPVYTVVRKLRNSSNLMIYLGNLVFLSLNNTKYESNLPNWSKGRVIFTYTPSFFYE